MRINICHSPVGLRPRTASYSSSFVSSTFLLLLLLPYTIVKRNVSNVRSRKLYYSNIVIVIGSNSDSRAAVANSVIALLVFIIDIATIPILFLLNFFHFFLPTTARDGNLINRNRYDVLYTMYAVERVHLPLNTIYNELLGLQVYI